MAPPLVLIAGAGCDQTIWPPALLKSAGLRVVPLDLPGHGRTAGPPADSIEGYADFVLNFLDRERLAPALLCGHSMGGGVALTAALRAPASVAGLTLVSTGARLRVSPIFLRILKRRWLYRLAVRIAVESAFPKGAPPETKRLVYDLMFRMDPGVLYNDLVACDRFDLTARLGEIRAPTLVVCGREDRLTPLRYSQFLAERIPGARLTVIDDAAHMLMFEQPDRLTRVIQDWMERP